MAPLDRDAEQVVRHGVHLDRPLQPDGSRALEAADRLDAEGLEDARNAPPVDLRVDEVGERVPDVVLALKLVQPDRLGAAGRVLLAGAVTRPDRKEVAVSADAAEGAGQKPPSRAVAEALACHILEVRARLVRHARCFEVICDQRFAYCRVSCSSMPTPRSWPRSHTTGTSSRSFAAR